MPDAVIRVDPLDPEAIVTKNGAVVRKVVALALALALQGAALAAPFVHAHPDDHATDHHAGRAIHTHWAGHATSSPHSHSPAIDQPDRDRAVFLNAFVAVTAAEFFAPAVALAVFVLPVPAERAAHRRIEVVRSHDPPGVALRSSRAPPAFLS